MALQRVRRGGRQLVAPDHVDEPVDADHPAHVQRQRRQYRLAAHTVHRLRTAGDDHLHRPEQPDAHARASHRHHRIRLNPEPGNLDLFVAQWTRSTAELVGATLTDVLRFLSSSQRRRTSLNEVTSNLYRASVTRSDWSDVRERLARLAAAPSAVDAFESSGHGWQLEPPMRAEELAEAEAQLQVELPGEYRSFLLEAGRGGAGPTYGLFPMRRTNGRWQWEGDGASLTDLDTLGQPFPHVVAFNPADDLPEPPDEANYHSVDEFNAAEDEYWRTARRNRLQARALDRTVVPVPPRLRVAGGSCHQRPGAGADVGSTTQPTAAASGRSSMTTERRSTSPGGIGAG